MTDNTPTTHQDQPELQEQLALLQTAQHTTQLADIVDTDCLQVIAQYCFDRQLPILINLHLLEQARPVSDIAGTQPLSKAGVTIFHRRLLQGFKGGLAPAHLLQPGARLIEFC